MFMDEENYIIPQNNTVVSSLTPPHMHRRRCMHRSNSVHAVLLPDTSQTKLDEAHARPMHSRSWAELRSAETLTSRPEKRIERTSGKAASRWRLAWQLPRFSPRLLQEFCPSISCNWPTSWQRMHVSKFLHPGVTFRMVLSGHKAFTV